MLLRPPSVGHCLAVWGANLHGNGRWMKRVYQGVARNPKVSPYGPLRAAQTRSLPRVRPNQVDGGILQTVKLPETSIPPAVAYPASPHSKSLAGKNA